MTREEHLVENPLESVGYELQAMHLMYGAYAGMHDMAGIRLFLMRNAGRIIE